MPISKNGKAYFTDKQYKTAQAVSALEYARAAGYDLVRDGGRGYHLREHDSMIFTADGRWFWNSRGVRGRALQFLVYYENRSLPEAVNILAEDTPHHSIPKSAMLPPERKSFELPERAPNFKRLFAYLCKTRHLNADLVDQLVHQGRLYETVHFLDRPGSPVVEIHNAIFVGLDANGIPRSGFQRGLNSNHPFKRDLPGSDKSVAFCVPGHQNTQTVIAFEASIDAMSDATLARHFSFDKTQADRISLGGVAAAPLLRYLQEHPSVHKIGLGLDNDPSGQKAVQQIFRKLSDTGYTPDAGYSVFNYPPPAGKDWNDFLLYVFQDPLKIQQYIDLQKQLGG